MNRLCAEHGKIIKGVIVSAICLFCLLILCACNDAGGGKTVKESERDLYISDIRYNEDMTLSVVVSMKGDDEDKLDSTLGWKSSTYGVDLLFKQEDVEMTVDPVGLAEELDGRIPEEKRYSDGIKYNGLKVVLEYDTIYKSIKSNASIIKKGNRYYHFFDLDEAVDEQVLMLELKTPITANWYTILISVVLALGVVITAVALAAKGKLWQRKKK